MADPKPKGGGAERGAVNANLDQKNLEGQADVGKGSAYQGEPAGAGSKGPLIGFLVVAFLLAVVILVLIL